MASAAHVNTLQDYIIRAMPVLAKKAHTKRRKKRAKKEPELLPMEQDDTFFFIAGYTSGGAPYGLTWEEMGLEPWEDME